MVVALTEIVPASVRTSGFSLAYSLATTLGGFSLAISTWLIKALADNAAPGIWLSLAAACGLVVEIIVAPPPHALDSAEKHVARQRGHHHITEKNLEIAGQAGTRSPLDPTPQTATPADPC